MSTIEKPFFADSPPTYADWLATAETSLKGKPFAKLLSQTCEGITLQPIYQAKDIGSLPYLDNLPGRSFVCGSKLDGYLIWPWLDAQEMAYSTPPQFNAALKHDLVRGQTAVNLIPDAAARGWGDARAVGQGGVALSGVADLAVVLCGVILTRTPIFMRCGSGALPLAALFFAYVKQTGADLTAVRGSLEADPLSELAWRGTLPLPLEKVFDELAQLVQVGAEVRPSLGAITVHGYPYANGGAGAVQELAFVLATAISYLRTLQELELSVDTIAHSMQFALSAGGDFFMEIAKPRAPRLLWAQVVRTFGGGEEAQKMVQHGRTLRYNKTRTDPYAKMLRVAAKAFAAALGGVDSLHVVAFDEEADERRDNSSRKNSRRIARNLQVILQEEANLTQLIDPVGGSWYVQWLTDQVAQRAWALFQEVERQGGMITALQLGWMQEQVAEAATSRAQNLAKRKDVLVGTNLYTNSDEKLETGGWGSADGNSPFTVHNLATPVAATESGATINQLTAALRAGYSAKDYSTISPIPQHRAAKPFKQLRTAASAAPQRPRIFLANRGPLRQHKARADFAGDFFAVGGFEIVYSQGFSGTETVVTAALADGPQAVVICSMGETYPELIPSLVQKLKAAKSEMVVILAGYPKEYVASFKAAGVDQFIYLGADCVAINQWPQQTINHNP